MLIAALFAAVHIGSIGTAVAEPVASLLRIRGATLCSPDLRESAASYGRFLGYRSIESGTVSTPLATSWDAVAMAGASYELLQGAAGDDVYLRLVECDAPDLPQPNPRAGWSAIEFLTKDTDRLHEKLSSSPFLHLSGPDFLTPGSTIRAVQYSGSAGETLYFTSDKGPRDRSTLALARVEVDRPFIVVLAGESATEIEAFYGQTFALQVSFRAALPIPFLARSQGIDPGHRYPISLLRLGEFSNAIEVDEYPRTKSLSAQSGHLPQGIALVSFEVDELQGVEGIAAPRRPAGAMYQGGTALTLRGPVGERIELIAAKPATNGQESPSAPAGDESPSHRHKDISL